MDVYNNGMVNIIIYSNHTGQIHFHMKIYTRSTKAPTKMVRLVKIIKQLFGQHSHLAKYLPLMI